MLYVVLGGPRHLAILVVCGGLLFFVRNTTYFFDWLSIDEPINYVEKDESAHPDLNDQEILNDE